MFYAHGYDAGSKQNRLTQWSRIKEKTGKPIKWLDDRPDCPPELSYVWDLYLTIKKGADKIDYNTVNNYSSLMNDKLTPFEVNLLIDTEYLRQRENDGHS